MDLTLRSSQIWVTEYVALPRNVTMQIYAKARMCEESRTTWTPPNEPSPGERTVTRYGCSDRAAVTEHQTSHFYRTPPSVSVVATRRTTTPLPSFVEKAAAAQHKLPSNP